MSRELRDLVHQMAEANPLSGAPRIHGELMKLGIEISERTVCRLMPKRRKPPSQTLRTFLENHANELISFDFLHRPYRYVSGLVCPSGARSSPPACDSLQRNRASLGSLEGQQMVEAFPEATAPRYLLRDRDKIYGREFRERIQSMNIEEVLSAPASLCLAKTRSG